MTTPAPALTSSIPRRRWFVGILLVLGVAVVVWNQDVPAILEGILDWIRGLGNWGLAMFALVYIVSSLLLIPATILTLGAGATFGPELAFPLVWFSATAAAMSAFVVGRYAARGWIQNRVAGDARLTALDESVGKAGWKIVLLSRLSPLFPFTILNYAFGLTRIPIFHYGVATWAGMFPGILLYVYAGTVLGDLAGLRPGTGKRSTAEWILSAAGLVITAGVTLYVARLARRALKQSVPQV